MTATIDRTALAESAAQRGLSLTRLAAEAGISSNALAKINKGEPVRASVAKALDDALGRIPPLELVQINEAAS